ncbi:protein of unknown function [Modestobacter italicus]|uniref:Uncharacterized protein n=1 Tax=Modestobacter italicus (strain DSM 44449 / CECT 9708 / BC 501) TaxID=2732864 RepID=I4F0W5_MODI5|nr:hypothetical protein [Modestobacter marinus]CCH89278.1 protein of unknown function [Modestobacter marinus]
MDTPAPSRVTARQMPNNPHMPRDAFAGILSWQFHHNDPQHGERVRVFDRLSGDFLAEGIWEHRLDQPDGSYMAVVHTDADGTFSIPAGARPEVVNALPRPRPAALTEAELSVAAELLAELGAVYASEPLGGLASEVAHKIAEAIGMELDE